MKALSILDGWRYWGCAQSVVLHNGSMADIGAICKLVQLPASTDNAIGLRPDAAHYVDLQLSANRNLGIAQAVGRTALCPVSSSGSLHNIDSGHTCFCDNPESHGR
jgi:hypothetical protein